MKAFAAAAALLLGLCAGPLADNAADLLHRCRSHDGRWLLAARDVPPTLLLFDAQSTLSKTWPVVSRKGQQALRIAAIVDAPARRSFVVALSDPPTPARAARARNTPASATGARRWWPC